MPSLRLLCLHGAGTNSDILKYQLSSLGARLEKENIASLEFVEGEYESEPGPGIDPNVVDGPYKSYYKWPQTPDDVDTDSKEEAFELLDDVLENDGPFDGILGFSYGGTTAYEYLARYHERKPEETELPVRCMMIFNSPPPYHVEDDGQLVFEELPENQLSLPSLLVTGKKDFAHEYSKQLFQSFDDDEAIKVTTNVGHDIPREGQDLTAVAQGVRKLSAALLR